MPIGEELFREVFDHVPLHDLPEHDGRALQARQRLSDRMVDVQNEAPRVCRRFQTLSWSDANPGRFSARFLKLYERITDIVTEL